MKTMDQNGYLKRSLIKLNVFLGKTMKSSLRFFCPITEWKEVVGKRGKGVGNKWTERIILGLDTWNWCICKERQDDPGVFTDKKYYDNLRILFMELPNVTQQWKDAINRIIGTLVEKTGVSK